MSKSKILPKTFLFWFAMYAFHSRNHDLLQSQSQVLRSERRSRQSAYIIRFLISFLSGDFQSLSSYPFAYPYPGVFLPLDSPIAALLLSFMFILLENPRNLTRKTSVGDVVSQSRDRSVRPFYPCAVLASEKAQTSAVEITHGFSSSLKRGNFRISGTLSVIASAIWTNRPSKVAAPLPFSFFCIGLSIRMQIHHDRQAEQKSQKKQFFKKNYFSTKNFPQKNNFSISFRRQENNYTIEGYLAVQLGLRRSVLLFHREVISSFLPPLLASEPLLCATFPYRLYQPCSFGQ